MKMLEIHLLGDNYRVNSLASNNGLVINVGTSSIPHTYESGGTITVGVPTNNFSKWNFYSYQCY